MDPVGHSLVYMGSGRKLDQAQRFLRPNENCLGTESRHQLVDRVARGSHLTWAEKGDIDWRLKASRVSEQAMGGSFGNHVAART